MTIIKNLTIGKVDKADPRYPDPVIGHGGRNLPFSDVYLLSFQTDDGRDLEAPFFVFDERPVTSEEAAAMLQVFAGAISRADQKQAA